MRALLTNGAKVRALARPQSDTANLAGLNLDIVYASLEDETALLKAMQGCEWIFHVAAHYSLMARDAASIYRTNVDGTRNVLRAARLANIKRLVHTSSVAAIGVAANGSLANEQTQTNLKDLIGDYKKSKYLSEALARQAASEGLPVVIVNPSTPIGPYDRKPTPTGDIIVRFLRRKMPFYVNTGLNLVHVADVAQGHILAAERGRIGERYILGNCNVTLKEMLDLLSSITGLPAPTKAIPHWIPIAVGYLDEMLLSRITGRPPQVSVSAAKMSKQYMYYSTEKAKYELGLQNTPIEQALKEAVDWFVENRYA